MPKDGGGGSAPAAPNYEALAKQQAEESQKLAAQQTTANRPSQYTPWASQTWNPYTTTDPTTGQKMTGYQQFVNLNPQQQAALTAQQGTQQQRQELGQQLMPGAAYTLGQPYNYEDLPGLSMGPQAQLTGQYQLQQGVNVEPQFGESRKRIENALFERMRPEQQFQEDRTRTMLANQGLTPGSAAYNRELERLHQQQAGERFNALQTGGMEQQRLQQQALAEADLFNRSSQGMFGMEQQANAQNFAQMTSQAGFQNQLRNQAIAEQNMARGQQLGDINALQQGQGVQNPQFPSFAPASAGQGANLMGAASNSYEAALNAYNAQQQSESDSMSGILGLAGTIGGSMIGAPWLGAAISGLGSLGGGTRGVPGSTSGGGGYYTGWVE